MARHFWTCVRREDKAGVECVRAVARLETAFGEVVGG